MKFVYSKADEFCTSTFTGNREIALANGYKEVTDEMYAKLCNHTAHWVDEELLEREKTVEEIAAEEAEIAEAAKQSEISQLKANLASTDYVAIKFAEGWITVEEYIPTKTQRQAWRDRINVLESAR